MAFSRPVGVFGLKVPPSGLRIDANPGLPAAIQISMAAIDPTEVVTTSGDAPARATLKIVRNIFDVVDDYDSEDDDGEEYDEDDIEAIRARLGITSSDDEEEDEDEDESDEEMVNGAGPSDPEKTRKKIQEAVLKKLEEDEEDEEMADITNGINGNVNKGKARALLVNDDDDDSEDEMSEYVVCTLDPTQHYQQPINITIGENEECYFRVSGSHTVHLTGNFIIPTQDIDGYSDEDSEDEEDEDLEARLLACIDSDELEDDYEEDSEEDLLDDLEDPRITEVDSEDEEAPQLIKADAGKKNKKRPAEDAGEYTMELLEKIAQQEEEKPKSKKQKNNEGKAISAETKPESKKEAQKNKKEKEAKVEAKAEANGKKVQFAEKLEQGPTPSKTSTPVKKVVQGVTVEDRKTGTGPISKKGDKVGMRYIGKLKDGKVFDSNKKGKPFSFKIGSGEVIKGWDIGVAGMNVGGERRIIVPAHLAYGKKAMPGIPGNSELTFDLKLISIN